MSSSIKTIGEALFYLNMNQSSDDFSQKNQGAESYVRMYYQALNEEESDDAINHPQHYTAGGIETIDFIEAKLSRDNFIGYLWGNVIKYISRWEIKGKPVEDLKKAVWYTNKLIEFLEKTE